MRLADIPARLVEATLRKWRRRAIAFAVMAVCALIAVIEGLAAARLALEFVLGPVSARLVLVGLCVAILATAAFIFSRAEAAWHEHTATTAGEGAFTREDRISLIAEAIDLGYLVARDFKKRPSRDDDAPAADDALAADGAAVGKARHRNGAGTARRAAGSR